MGFNEFSVHFRMPVGDPVHFIDARLADQMLAARAGHVDVGIQNRLVGMIRDRAMTIRKTSVFEPRSLRHIVGGVRVRVVSDVWDGTLRNRLERLQQQF